MKKRLDQIKIKDIHPGMKIKNIKTNREGIISNIIKPCDSFFGDWEIQICLFYETKKRSIYGFYFDEKNKIKNYILI